MHHHASSTTAFVPAPLAPAAPALLRPASASSAARTPAASSLSMSAPVGAPRTTFAGGLDRLSADPVQITRYLFKDRPAVSVDEEADASDKEVLITRAYRHLFGNAYVMESERAELAVVESQYKAGNISARDFVRALAKSHAYKSRFFDAHSQFRFIELNFKHLLGRAPTDQLEVSEHYQIFAQAGYDAEIDSYVDSDEYLDVFGLDTMPYTRFRGTYAPNSTFNMQCKVQGGWARSDKKLNQPAWFTPTTAAQVSNGLPPIQNAEHPSKFYQLPEADLARYLNERQIAFAKLSGLQSELDAAYHALQSSKDFLQPYKDMLKDSKPITPVFGSNFGGGAVQVFAGQYIGTPKGEWGVTGVEAVRGRSRRVAADIAKKEARVESVKALMVDIEKKIDLLTAEAAHPVVTPGEDVLNELAASLEAQGATPENARAAAAAAIAETASAGYGGASAGVDRVAAAAEAAKAAQAASAEATQAAIDAVNADEVPFAAAPVTPRELNVIDARTMAQIKLKSVALPEVPAAGESEEEGEGGGDFLGGKGPKPSFAGDGSEMIVG